MVRRKRGHVDQSVFETAKLLLGHGLSMKKVGDVVGLSITTISRINMCADLEDYRGKISTIWAGYPKVAENPAPNPTDLQPTGVDEFRQAELQILQNLTTALNDMSKSFDGMSNKLEEVLETKRPWFQKVKNS